MSHVKGTKMSVKVSRSCVTSIVISAGLQGSVDRDSDLSRFIFPGATSSSQRPLRLSASTESWWSAHTAEPPPRGHRARAPPRAA